MSNEIEEDDCPESGPYCSHWDEIGMCDELCKCGHSCGRHFAYSSCDEDGCDCKEFVDVKGST